MFVVLRFRTAGTSSIKRLYTTPQVTALICVPLITPTWAVVKAVTSLLVLSVPTSNVGAPGCSAL
jgi:hypothetical protein